jgi:NitT/TauT family transport system permease protein
MRHLELDHATPVATDESLDRAAQPASRRRRMAVRVLHWFVNSPLYPLSGAVALLLIWQFVVAAGYVPGIASKFLGSPSGVFSSFLQMASHGYNDHSLADDLESSLFRCFTGFALGVVVAVPLGLLMGEDRRIGNMLIPIFSFLRPIPALSFIPVVIIWFGIGNAAMILVIFWTAFIYTVVGASAGVRSTPHDFLLVAANYHLSRFQRLRRVILPSAMPQILVSVRTGMALSWAVVITAELLGAQTGLGVIIEQASTLFQINDVFVGITFIGLIGIIMEFGFRYLESRLLHWQGKTR